MGGPSGQAKCFNLTVKMSHRDLYGFKVDIKREYPFQKGVFRFN